MMEAEKLFFYFLLVGGLDSCLTKEIPKRQVSSSRVVRQGSEAPPWTPPT